jgi:preprotein translocase subunit SecB
VTSPGAGSLEAAARLGGVATPRAILLREVNFKTHDIEVRPELAQANAEQSLKLDSDFNVAFGRDGALIRYRVSSTLTGDVESGELFRCELVHEAYFSLPEDYEVSDEELESYGSITVFFMVFPYIREFVHLLTGNAGLPSLMLAPYRLPFDPSATQSAVSPSES